jgi:hypothetical protein
MSAELAHLQYIESSPMHIIPLLIQRITRLEEQVRRLQVGRPTVAIAPPAITFGEWLENYMIATEDDLENLMTGGVLEPILRIAITRALQAPELPLRVFNTKRTMLFVYRHPDCDKSDGWELLQSSDVADIGNKLQVGLMVHLLAWKRRHADELENNNAMFQKFNKIPPKLFTLSKTTLTSLQHHIVRMMGGAVKNSTPSV